MRGRRPEADHRFTFHGSRERAENDADGLGSVATVERSISDRLPGTTGPPQFDACVSIMLIPTSV